MVETLLLADWATLLIESYAKIPFTFARTAWPSPKRQG